MELDPDVYPILCTTNHWDWANADVRFELLHGRDVPDIVSNVYIFGYVGDRLVIVRNASHGFPVGGTLEAGETWREALPREAMEEAGARVVDATPFGGHRSRMLGARPYKPWLPFPDAFWLCTHGAVELVADPTCPDDGEQILEVAVLPIDEALARLEGCHHDVARLSWNLRTGGHP